MTSCEYIEFEDSKSSLLLTATQDPIIEINSDSEEEPSASSNPGKSSLSAAELNRLNKRQETAILELDIAAEKEGDSRNHVQASSSDIAARLGLRKRKAPRKPTTSSTSYPSVHLPFKDGWKVITSVTSNQFNTPFLRANLSIPCPQCHEPVKIKETSSLTDHLKKFHPDQDWNAKQNSRHCVHCPQSKRHLIYSAKEVFAHMCTVHKINLKGPMAHPAWVPADNSATMFICPECQMPVPTEDLTNHVAQHLRYDCAVTKKQRKVKTAHICGLCTIKTRESNTSIDVRHLQDHLEQVHGRPPMRSSGWIVENSADSHFIPCPHPQCNQNVIIVNRFSLMTHVKECHPEEQWRRDYDYELYKWNCQLCPATEAFTLYSAEEVFDHMLKNHGYSLRFLNLSTDAKKKKCLEELPASRKKVWTFYDDWVRCKDCPAVLKVGNMTSHFRRCHNDTPSIDINDGICSTCNKRVKMSLLAAHANCRPPTSKPK